MDDTSAAAGVCRDCQYERERGAVASLHGGGIDELKPRHLQRGLVLRTEQGKHFAERDAGVGPDLIHVTTDLCLERTERRCQLDRCSHWQHSHGRAGWIVAAPSWRDVGSDHYVVAAGGAGEKELPRTQRCAAIGEAVDQLHDDRFGGHGSR